MKINPIYKRETTVSARSFRLSIILMIFNGILAVVALLNMYSVLAQVKLTAEIQYSAFLDLYVFVAVMEFIMLMFITPALTAGSISGERERQTLDLMLTTNMKPSQIVLGKLFASFSTMFLLIVSSFPVLALVFVFGGVTAVDVAELLMCYVAVALMAGSMGICFSSVFKRSAIATVVTYGVLILIAAGTYAVNQFVLSIAKMNADSYMNTVGSMAETTNSGGFLYLLLFNPVSTFIVMISSQAGSDPRLGGIGQWFGPHPDNFVLSHWVMISIALQLAVAALLLFAAVRAVNPLKKRRTKLRPGGRVKEEEKDAKNSNMLYNQK